MRNFNSLVNSGSGASHNRSVAKRIVPNVSVNKAVASNQHLADSIKETIKLEEHKTMFKWEEKNIGYNPPVMTVGIIDHNMAENLWMAMESLKNQLNIVFTWELIVIEEDGKSRETITNYIGNLPGCVRVIFKTVLPGSGRFVSSVLKSQNIHEKYTCMEKFCDIMKLADKSSNIFVKQEAGSFSPLNRLYNHFIQFRDGECFASTQLKGYIYDMANDSIGYYDGDNIEPYRWDTRISELVGNTRLAYDNPSIKIRSTHLNNAYRLSKIRHIPLLERPITEKDLDDIIFIAAFMSSNRRPEESSIVRHDIEIDDCGWESGITILGSSQLQRDQCISYNDVYTNNVPEYVLDRLKSIHCKHQSLALAKKVSDLQNKRDVVKKTMETREREQLEILKHKQELADVLEKRITEEKALMKIHTEQQTKLDMQQMALDKAKEHRESQERQLIEQNNSLQTRLQEEAARIELETKRLNEHALQLKSDRLKEEALIKKKRQETERLQREKDILEQRRAERIEEEDMMMKEADSLQLRSMEDILEVEKAAKEMKDKIAELEKEQKKEKQAILAREKEYAELKAQERDFEIARKKRIAQEEIVIKEKEELRQKLERNSIRMQEDAKKLNIKLKQIQEQKTIEQERIAQKKAEKEKVKEEEAQLERLLKVRVEQEEALLSLEREKIKQQEQDLALARIRHSNHEKAIEKQATVIANKAKQEMDNHVFFNNSSNNKTNHAYDQKLHSEDFSQKKPSSFHANVRQINLIGLKDVNCSISENVYLFKKYIEDSSSVYNVTIYDLKDVNAIEKISSLNDCHTIFCLQPFELVLVLPQLRKFKIKPSALWVWEFKSLPPLFKKFEQYFNKVYVPSGFCYNIFNKHLSIPIILADLKSPIHFSIEKIPSHAIANKKVNDILTKTADKVRYGFCFDLNSSIVRKNPINLVKAFRSMSDQNSVLILKFRRPRSGTFINKIEYELFSEFDRISRSQSNIYLIDEELDKMDLYKLYTYLDYYISPHCGEGFGFTIYDNMVLGNTIISPFYSGETSYLDRDKILELDYEEKEIHGLQEHPIYGQMSSFKGAVISVENIINCIKGRNIAKSKDVVVLSCGPSLNEYSVDSVKEFCKGKKVLCVKDAVSIYKDICDVFIANQHNDKMYDLDGIPHKIYQKDFEDPKFNSYDTVLENENSHRYGTKCNDINPNDIKEYYNNNSHRFSSIGEAGNYYMHFGVYEENGDLSKTMLSKKNFDKYRFSNQNGRPRGPGILYESVFFLCLDWGVKNVYTIGWDLNTDGKSHFNSQRGVESKYVNEFRFVNENIGHLYRYFKNNGLSINVVGRTSSVNSVIPRVGLSTVNIITIHGGLGDIIKQYNLLLRHINANNIVICVTAVAFDLRETVDTLFKSVSHKIVFFAVTDRNLEKFIRNIRIKELDISKEKDFIIEKASSVYNDVMSDTIVSVAVNKIFTINKINYRFSSRKDYDFMRDESLYYRSIPISRLYNQESSRNLYEKVVNRIGKDYILIHSRPKDNCNRSLLPIHESLFLNDNLPVYNFDFDSDLNYGIKSNNIFDYYDIVKNAKEIHTYNGSLSHFIDYMDIELNNLHFHMYCKDKEEKIDYETYIKENIRQRKWHNKKWVYHENKNTVILASSHGYGIHNFGWEFIMEQFSDFLMNKEFDSKLILDPFLEKTVFWERKKNYYTSNWVGFIHNPEKSWNYSNVDLINSDFFKGSEKYCLGLFCLSDHHRKYLQTITNIPIYTVYHPSNLNNSFKKFDYSKYLKNENKTIIQVGYFMRRIQSIFQIDTRYKKSFVPNNERFKRDLALSILYDKDRKVYDTRNLKVTEEVIAVRDDYLKNKKNYNVYEIVKYDQHLPTESYFETFEDNIGFIDLYDNTANNFILECISNKIPLLINRTKSSEEYLGKNYPLFYTDISEIDDLLRDEIILDAHNYLTNYDFSFLGLDVFNETLYKKLSLIASNKNLKLVELSKIKENNLTIQTRNETYCRKLQNLFSNYSCLIISGGNSSKCVLDNIRLVDQTNTVIIAVKNVYRQLNNIGIYPDFLVSNFCNFDSNDHNRNKYVCHIHTIFTEQLKDDMGYSHNDVVMSVKDKLMNTYSNYSITLQNSSIIDDNFHTDISNNQNVNTFEHIISKYSSTHKWGDIIFESVIPLVLHINCDNIVISGVDYTYDSSNSGTGFKMIGDARISEKRAYVPKRDMQDHLVRNTLEKYLHSFMKTHYSNTNIKFISSNSAINKNLIGTFTDVIGKTVSIIQLQYVHLEVLPGILQYFKDNLINVDLYIRPSEKHTGWPEYLSEKFDNLKVKHILALNDNRTFEKYKKGNLATIFSSGCDFTYLSEELKNDVAGGHFESCQNVYDKILKLDNINIIVHGTENYEHLKSLYKVNFLTISDRLYGYDKVNLKKINSYGACNSNDKVLKNSINIAIIGKFRDNNRDLVAIQHILENYPSIKIYVYCRSYRIDKRIILLNKRYGSLILSVDKDTRFIYNELKNNIHFVWTALNFDNEQSAYYNTSFSGCYQDAVNNRLPLIIDRESNNVFGFYLKQHDFIYENSLLETIEMVSRIDNKRYRSLVEEIEKFYTRKSNENIKNFRLLI